MMLDSSVSSSSSSRKGDGSEEHRANRSEDTEGARSEETSSASRHADLTWVEGKAMNKRSLFELRVLQEERDSFSSPENTEEVKDDKENSHLLLEKRTVVSSCGVSTLQEGEHGESHQETNFLFTCSHVESSHACEKLQEEKSKEGEDRQTEEGEEEVSDIYKKLFSTIEADYLTTPLSSPVLLGRATPSSSSSPSPPLPFALVEPPTSPSFTCSTRSSLSLPLPPASSPPPPPSLHLRSACLSPRLGLLLSLPEGLPPSCPTKQTHHCKSSSSADLLSSLLLSQRKDNDCLSSLQSQGGGKEGEEEGPLHGIRQESLISQDSLDRKPLSVQTELETDAKRTKGERREMTTGTEFVQRENGEVSKPRGDGGEEKEEGRRERERIDGDKRGKGDAEKDLVSGECLVAGFQERKKGVEVGSSSEDDQYREALPSTDKSVRCSDTRKGASTPSLSASYHSLSRSLERSLQTKEEQSACRPPSHLHACEELSPPVIKKDQISDVLLFSSTTGHLRETALPVSESSSTRPTKKDEKTVLLKNQETEKEISTKKGENSTDAVDEETDEITSLVEGLNPHQAMMATDPSSSSSPPLDDLSSSCSSFSSSSQTATVLSLFLTGEKSDSHLAKGLLREKREERSQSHPILEEGLLSKMENDVSPPSTRTPKIEQGEKSLRSPSHSISTDGEEKREGEKNHRLLANNKKKPDHIKYCVPENEEIFYRRRLSSSGDSEDDSRKRSYPDTSRTIVKNRLHKNNDLLSLSSSPSFSSSSLLNCHNIQGNDSPERRMFHCSSRSSSSLYKGRDLTSPLHFSSLGERATTPKSVYGHRGDRYPSPLDRKCSKEDVVSENSSLDRRLLTGHSRDNPHLLPVSTPSSTPVMIPTDSRSSSSGLKASPPTCAQLQQFVLYASNFGRHMMHASPFSSLDSMSERKRRERRGENAGGVERETSEVDDEENKTNKPGEVFSSDYFNAVKKKSKKNTSTQARGGEEEDEKRYVKEENNEKTKGGGGKEEEREVAMEMKVEGSTVKKFMKKENEEEAEENERHEEVASSSRNLRDSLSVPLLFPSAVGTPQQGGGGEDCLLSLSSSSLRSTASAFSSSSSPSSSLPTASRRPPPLVSTKEEEEDESSEPPEGSSASTSSKSLPPLLCDAVYSAFSSSLSSLNSRDLSVVNDELLSDTLDSPLSLLVLLVSQRGQSSHHLTNFVPKDHLALSQDEKLSSSPSSSSPPPVSKDSQSSFLGASFHPPTSDVFTSTTSIESEGASVLSSYIRHRLSSSPKTGDTLQNKKQKKASSLLSTPSFPKGDFSSSSSISSSSPSRSAVPLSPSSSSVSASSHVLEKSPTQHDYFHADLLTDMREKNEAVVDQKADYSYRTSSGSSPASCCASFHGHYMFSRFISSFSPSSQHLREEKRKRNRSMSSDSVMCSDGSHEESARIHQEESKNGSKTIHVPFSTSSSPSSSLSPSKKVCLDQTRERSLLATTPRGSSPQVDARETSAESFISESDVNSPRKGSMNGHARRENSTEIRGKVPSTAAPLSLGGSSEAEERKMGKMEEQQRKSRESRFAFSSAHTNAAGELIVGGDVSRLSYMVEQEEGRQRQEEEEEGRLPLEGSPKSKSGERRQVPAKKETEEKEMMKDSHENEDKRKGEDFGVDEFLAHEFDERDKDISLFSLHAKTEESKKTPFHCHSTKQEDRREREDPEDCQHARLLLLLSPVSSFSSSSSTSCEDHMGTMCVSRKKSSDEKSESLRRPSSSSSVVSSNELKEGDTMNERDDVEKEKNEVSSSRRIRTEALLTRGRSTSKSRESEAELRLRWPVPIGSHLDDTVVKGGSSGEERAEEEENKRRRTKKKKKEGRQTARDLSEKIEGGYRCLDRGTNDEETLVGLLEGVEGREEKRDDGEVPDLGWRNKEEQQCVVDDRGDLAAFLSSRRASTCQSSKVCEDSYLAHHMQEGGCEVAGEVGDRDRRETESVVMGRRRSIRHPRKEEKHEQEQDTFLVEGNHREGRSSYCISMKEEQEEDQEEEKGYDCLICSAVFPRDSSLKHHLRTVHGGGDKPFACPLCKKTFRYNRGNLEQHIQAVHRGIKPFECKICKKAFSQKGNLGQHIRAVHAGKKPFQCPECLRAFSRKSHLTRHIESLGHKRLSISPSSLPLSSLSSSYGNEDTSEQLVNTSR